MLISCFEERNARHKSNLERLLKFLRDEVWSNSIVLADVLGLTKTGIYNVLGHAERGGLILSHHVPELQHKIYGITQLGLLYSWGEQEQMEHRSYFEPSKVKPITMNHYLLTQMARLRAERAGWQAWQPGHLLKTDLTKRPDATVKNISGAIIAVELERTVKSKKRYEAIFADYLQAIKRNEYESIHYVCPDKDFADRLSRFFKTFQTIPIAGQRVALTEKHIARFPVYSLSDWPPLL